MEELVAPLLSGVSNGDGGARSVSLATPDLHLLLERMQVRTEETKDRVYATVKMHYKDFVEVIERANNAALNVEALQEELDNLLDDAAFETGPASFDARLWKLSAEVKSTRIDLSLKRSALSCLKSVSLMRGDILAGKQHFAEGNIVEGAKKIAGLRETIMSNEENLLLVFALLKQLWLSTFSEVQSILEDLFSRSVTVKIAERALVVTSITSAGSPVKLVAVLEAMELLGLLDGALTVFTDNVCKLLTDLIHNSSLVVTIDSTDNEHASLKMSNSIIDRETLSVKEVYERVVLFVKFLREHVASRRQPWMRKLGKLIWPRLADMIIQDHLRKAIPTDHTEFQAFEKIQAHTSEFENALQAEKFIVLDEQGGKLTNFTSNVEAHFSVNKRKRLLAKARHLIVEFDYGLFVKMLARSTERDKLTFKEDNYVVSYLPKQLLSIVHETLKDACSSTPRIASELYKAARDIILLFRALAPLQFSDSIVQAAPIFHNDCLYIAQQLMSLSDQYSSSFPVTLESPCDFKDLVPLFQSLGNSMLSEQIKSLNTQLMRVLDDADGFKYTDKEGYREAAQSALHQVVSILKSAEVIWHEFLPRSVEAKQLVDLTDSAIRRILSDILSIEDMAAEETVQLHSLLEELMLGLHSVLACLESPRKPLERIIPSWKKLKCLSEILEMSLRPITKAWETGTLSAAGFSASEVRHLIKAIFTDTMLRSDCLQNIF